MYRLVDKIRFWDSSASKSLPGDATGGGGGGGTAACFTEKATLSCSDETIIYRACHLCAHDPILGAVLLVGDNVPVVVLVRGRRRVSLRVRGGVHWIQCYVFAGTSSFLLLSPESLLLLDYTQRNPSSALFPRGRSGELFACLHVPQGVTWGVVGCRNGSVMYWKLRQEGSRVSLVWAALTTDLLYLCRPCLPATTPELCGHISTVDSYSTSPNALIAVLYGVPGVCKWRMDENRLSTFFSASETVAAFGFAACRVTPGGVYITATTFDISVVFVWLDGGKKSNCVEPMWVVETGCRPLSVAGGAQLGNVMGGSVQMSPCGIHVTRSAGTSSQAQSDKKCHMHLLLYSDRELVELGVDLGKKRLLQREDILAHMAAVRTPSLPMLEAKDALMVQHVIPCARSNYWLATWTQEELDLLLVASDSSGPLLVQRCRQKRSVECITELEDLPRGATAWSGMVLLAPPRGLMEVVRTVLRTAQDGGGGGEEEEEKGDDKDVWNAILGGAELVSTRGVEKQDEPMFLVVTTGRLGCSVCLLPMTNECVPIPFGVIEQGIAWPHRSASENTRQRVILEQVLPEAPQAAEFILYALADEETVSVCAVRLWPRRLEHLVCLSRESLMPGAASAVCGSTENDGGGIVACRAILVECRVERNESVPSQFRLLQGGRSIFIQLCDASFVLVDMSDSNNGAERSPAMVHYPSGLFPAGTNVTSFDTAWVKWDSSSDRTRTGERSEMCLILVCILSEQKGVVVWDMSRMRLLSCFLKTESGKWCYNAVMAVEEETFLHTSAEAAAAAAAAAEEESEAEVGGFTVAVSRAEVSTTTTDATAEARREEEGEVEGHLRLRDVFGRLIASVCIRHRLGESGGWYVRKGGDNDQWDMLLSGDAMTLRFLVKVHGGEILVTADGGCCLGEALVPCDCITTLEVDCSWPFVTSLWDSNGKRIEEERSQKKFSWHPRAVGTQRKQVTKLLLYNNRTVDFFHVTQLMSSGNEKGPAATCRFEPDRSIEQVLPCETFHAVLVLTKDSNGWRWISVLDVDTAKHMMEPYAMIQFDDQDDLRFHPVPVDGGSVHLYILGSPGGVLGHLVLAPTVSNGAICCDQRTHGPPLSPKRAPAPANFREYMRSLPPPPTMKQEQGFLKRLMALPWEEVVAKLEGEVLREVRVESFDDFQKRLSVLVGEVPLHGRREADPTPKGDNLLPRGGRYAELKSTAARENISLSEARCIMNENQTRLHERGERIAEIESKSRELANEAATFQQLARQLKEKQQRRWF